MTNRDNGGAEVLKRLIPEEEAQPDYRMISSAGNSAFVNFVLLWFSVLSVMASHAQDQTPWGLPEGVFARLGVTVGGGDRAVTYSHDGTRLAVANSLGIRTYDAQTYNEGAGFSPLPPRIPPAISRRGFFRKIAPYSLLKPWILSDRGAWGLLSNHLFFRNKILVI